MKNYQDTDYALNRYSEGIVYRFADKTLTVTLADYLSENPGKSEEDFRALKALSDADYLERDRAENAQTKKNTPFQELKEITQSPEELLICAVNAMEESERRQRRLDMAKSALDKLTKIQRRRYLLHVVQGLSTWQIAELEGTNQKTVYESLAAAEKKIKKVLSED